MLTLHFTKDHGENNSTSKKPQRQMLNSRYKGFIITKTLNNIYGDGNAIHIRMTFYANMIGINNMIGIKEMINE